MLRTLRAFAWLRWRVLLNSLERTSARDTLERLSLAIEQLGPLMAAALLVPSAAGLAVLAGYAGYGLAAGDEGPFTLEILRYLLLGATAFCIAGPIMLPGAERTSAVRLLLLPVSRRVLYLAQTAGGIADPWILLSLPVVVALPLGLLAGGAPRAAVVATLSGAAFLLVLLGLSSLAGAALQLLVRNRRRGELAALLFIVFVPLIAVVPGMLDAQQRRAEHDGRSIPDESSRIVELLEAAGTTAFELTPSELHTRAVRAGSHDRAAESVPAVAMLLGYAAALHGVALIAFGRLLDSPFVAGGRRSAGTTVAWPRRIPGLSPGASAVAVAQLRTAFRTPRGRSTLLSPVVVTAIFAFLMTRGEDLSLGFVTLQGAVSLAVFGVAIALLSILPFAMNQFAMDRAGLTLVLLMPLPVMDLLMGKWIGNGLVAGIPAVLSMLGAWIVISGGPPLPWFSLLLGFVATYCLAAPFAAMLSAVLPRSVDLNSIGSRSNAHGLAGLLGIVGFALASAPVIGLTLLAIRILERPSLVAWLLLGWCLVSLLVCRLLLIPASVLFARRSENLALVAGAER